jgi:hypothetical protein
MKRTLVLAVALLLFGATSASAQPGYYPRSPYSSSFQPPLSPYLNLLRGGSPSANYFLGVLPAMDRNSAVNAVLTDGLAPRRVLAEDRDYFTAGDQLLPPPNPETGHPVRFLNYGNYYNLGGPQARPNFLTPYRPQQPARPR